MGTFDDKAMVDRMIAGNGWLPECGDHDAPDNPPAIRITAYTTPEGATAYGVVFEHERDIDRYQHPSQYIRNPRVIWERQPE